MYIIAAEDYSTAADGDTMAESVPVTQVRFCHTVATFVCIVFCHVLLASVFCCSIVYLEYRLRHGAFV